MGARRTVILLNCPRFGGADLLLQFGPLPWLVWLWLTRPGWRFHETGVGERCLRRTVRVHGPVVIG